MINRSIREEIIDQLKERIIPELLSRLENEVPELGKFEDISVCFNIPYFESVGTVLICEAVSVGQENRRLDIEVNRKDIDAACCIVVGLGTNKYIKNYLSTPNAAEVLAEKYKDASQLLAERYDEVYEVRFNEIWNN